ncbi:MAG: amidohydrolase [Acidobacteria bacterium]|nr:MAG: amidohydrolase [Acidobacteriota bacterium]
MPGLTKRASHGAIASARFMIAASVIFMAIPMLAQSPPETIYYNGIIVTMWPSHPVVEAVAINGGRFTCVGSNKDALRMAGPATVKVDLHGRCVLPGLIDSHCHPIEAALGERESGVPPLHSIADIQDYVRHRAAELPPRHIILVPHVFVTRLKERRYPTRAELDAASADRSVIVDNGYASVLNSAALKDLGISSSTAQPPDGKIIKDAEGRPTGLILGAPGLLVRLRFTLPATPQDCLWALQTMLHHYNEVGITSIIDRAEGPPGFRAYQQLDREGKLTARCYVTYAIDAQGTSADVRNTVLRIPFLTGWGDDWYRVGSLKTFVDGGICMGTAYLRAPYGTNTSIYGFQDSHYRGVLRVPEANLVAMAKTADELGWQMTAHTTGGGATDLLLQAYQAANREKSIRDLRFTVTHGDFPDPHAIRLAKDLGVSFDSQPAWLYLDGSAVKDVFGPARTANFIPLASLFRAGVVVAGGSDHMIGLDPNTSTNPYNPFLGMWIAITRNTVDGTVINSAQRISREQALRMYTLNGAYLSFDEKKKGSIEPGKLADMVVISKNYLSCPVDQIKSIQALRTIVGGRVVFDRLHWQ